MSEKGKSSVGSSSTYSPSSLVAGQRTLLQKLSRPPRHKICLRRAKYMVVRMASRALQWSTVKEDKDASLIWLDRWESGDLMNLAPPRKVCGENLNTTTSATRLYN